MCECYDQCAEMRFNTLPVDPVPSPEACIKMRSKRWTKSNIHEDTSRGEESTVGLCLFQESTRKGSGVRGNTEAAALALPAAGRRPDVD